MFHELLMALSGFPGTIFFDDGEKGMKVSSCIPNLHPAEKTILQRLCDIGGKYKILLDFVKKHKLSCTDPEDHSKIRGLYLKSLCCGLEVVLNMYQQELVEIEEEILKDPFLPLTHFLKLENHCPLFEILCSMLIQMEGSEYHGCRLLELLYQHSMSGVPLIEVAINKILQSCHSVMYRQVFSLMINGCIEDPFKEFFIQPDASTKISHPQGFSSSCPEKDNIKYKLVPELIPSYIPHSLVATIKDAGEHVSILGAAENSDSYSLFLKKEKLFAKKFEKLIEKPTFSLLSFETTINDIRKCASEHLYEVIVKQSNVMNHFRILKDFYLLGKGELFLNFICEANQLLRMPITLSAETDASKLFNSVARRSFPDDDVTAEKFRIEFQDKKKSVDEIGKDTLSKAKLQSGWSAISLHYDVPSPVHILFTPNVIDRYNAVFRFLLSMRRVQIELHQCWALQMQNKRNCHDPTLIPFWTLRSNMSFLVDNYQYYVMVDVLESRFNRLVTKMESVKEYEDVLQCHENFLLDITSRCFLEISLVHQSLNDILDLCSSFCSLLNRLSVIRNQKEMAQFENIKLNFQRHSALFFRVLSNVRSHNVSPHLAQLLLRIDFNKYFSTPSAQLGRSK